VPLNPVKAVPQPVVIPVVDGIDRGQLHAVVQQRGVVLGDPVALGISVTTAQRWTTQVAGRLTGG